jgi:hypothetical protein
MDDFKPALLGHFTEVIKLCFRVLVASGYACVKNRAFAVSCFSWDFGFGS